MVETIRPSKRTDTEQKRVRIIARLLIWSSRHWLLLFNLLFGLWITAPFLAPVFMRLGWIGAGNAVYSFYGMFCHQMAQRSFFMFGAQSMYNVGQLPVVLTGTEGIDILVLRNFIGDPQIGWKVAWSDRMVYMYGSLWIAALIYAIRRRTRKISLPRLHLCTLFLFPMIVDGITHMVSDITGGLTGGFRYSNEWLASLTGHSLPSWFYIGDTFGSFNAWMRLVSGILFGVGVVWIVFPYFGQAIDEASTMLNDSEMNLHFSGTASD